LFFANKDDVPHAHPVDKIAESLNLDKLSGHQWHIVSCDAISGKGVDEGIKWLTETLKKVKK
jgi:signal recognition particle receptor subunit beta